jgi:hypothetical protein
MENETLKTENKAFGKHVCCRDEVDKLKTEKDDFCKRLVKCQNEVMVLEAKLKPKGNVKTPSASSSMKLHVVKRDTKSFHHVKNDRVSSAFHASCHYCGLEGHGVSQCWIRKNASYLKLVWVPKQSTKSFADYHGPKQAWVPKTKN